MKIKNILLTSLIIGSFLGCGSSSTTTNNEITDDKKISKGTVQLGFTEGAIVSINSLMVIHL